MHHRGHREHRAIARGLRRQWQQRRRERRGGMDKDRVTDVPAQEWDEDRATDVLSEPWAGSSLPAEWNERHLRTVPLWLVEETGLRWLWPGRIPLGTITLVDGDPGLGKSLLTLDLVARVTRGAAMPDGTGGGGGAEGAGGGGAGVVPRHLTRGGSTTAFYGGGGWMGIMGGARSGFWAARSPDDREHERILASRKSNLGPPLPALRYRIAPWTPEGDVPVVEWLGPCDYTAATLLSDAVTDAATAHAGRTTAVDAAAAWLPAQPAAGSPPGGPAPCRGPEAQ